MALWSILSKYLQHTFCLKDALIAAAFLFPCYMPWILFPGIFMGQGDVQALESKPVPPAGDLGNPGQKDPGFTICRWRKLPWESGISPIPFSLGNVGNHLWSAVTTSNLLHMQWQWHIGTSPAKGETTAFKVKSFLFFLTPCYFFIAIFFFILLPFYCLLQSYCKSSGSLAFRSCS